MEALDEEMCEMSLADSSESSWSLDTEDVSVETGDTQSWELESCVSTEVSSSLSESAEEVESAPADINMGMFLRSQVSHVHTDPAIYRRLECERRGEKRRRCDNPEQESVERAQKRERPMDVDVPGDKTAGESDSIQSDEPNLWSDDDTEQESVEGCPIASDDDRPTDEESDYIESDCSYTWSDDCEDKEFQETKYYQSSTDLCTNEHGFKWLCREILQDYSRLMRLTNRSIEALQRALEEYLTEVFRDACLAAIHARRRRIEPRDLQLARRIRGERA